MSTPLDDPRGFLRALYKAAVARALPEVVINRFLPPPPKGRTLVIGAGKAGAAMAAAVDALWPQHEPLSGLVVTRPVAPSMFATTFCITVGVAHRNSPVCRSSV